MKKDELFAEAHLFFILLLDNLYINMIYCKQDVDWSTNNEIENGDWFL